MKRSALAPIALLVVLLAGFPVFGQDPSAPAPQSAVASQFDLKPDTQGKLSQQQMQQLLRVVADKDLENDKRLRDYTYVERDVEHRIDGKGQVKSTEVKTYDVRKKKNFRKSSTSARTSRKAIAGSGSRRR